MKISAILIALFTLTVLTSCEKKSQNADTHISRTDSFKLNAKSFAGALKSSPDAVLVDVRTAKEFAGGHIDNAQNIDWKNDDFDKNIQKIDKNKQVYVYCMSGNRSGKAASHMRNMGFAKVYELDGGMLKWRAANLPETTGTTAQGMSLADFNAKTKSGNVVLVDFYADWCEPCKRMEPYLNKISQTMSDKVTVVRINVDENKELAKSLKIDALPVLQLYEKGSKTWENTGFTAEETVLTKLK